MSIDVSRLNDAEKAFAIAAQSRGITDSVELAQLMGQVKQESNFTVIEETLEYSAGQLFGWYPYNYRDRQGRPRIRRWGFKTRQEAESICCGKNKRALAERIYYANGLRTDLGNTAPGDGYKYRGRGLIQITGKANYRYFGSRIGVDLVNNPDLALDAKHSRDIAIEFWKERVKKAVTDFTDTEKVTKRVNGGNHNLTQRQQYFARYRQLLQGTGTPLPPAPTPAPAPAAVPPPTPEPTQIIPPPVTPTPVPEAATSEIQAEYITPYIFTYKSFHPQVQYELTRRKFATEAVDTYMPFVKLTSFTYVKPEDVAAKSTGKIAGWCPTVGIHGRQDVSADDIYRPFLRETSAPDFGESRANLIRNSSIVGELTVATNTQIEPGTEQTIIQRKLNLISRIPSSILDSDPPNIPTPGITSVVVDRSTAGPMGVRGGLFKIDVKMLAYSKNQVDTLLRYFLRPGTRVVLEYGKMSNNKNDFQTFDWARTPTELARELYEEKEYTVGNNEKIKQTFPANARLQKKYVYPSGGNYDILIGYVVKFNLKVNKNNVYDISLTIHSLQQYEIPNVQSAVKSLCANSLDSKCQSMDVREYFSPSVAWKQKTFAKLIAKYTDRNNTVFKDEIVKIKNSVGQSDGDRGYYVSWRFFIQVILNDPEFGILSIFPNQSKPIVAGSLISPFGSSTSDVNKYPEIIHDNTKLTANEVGWHPSLLSTDPNTMVIYNPKRITTNVSDETISAQPASEEYRNLLAVYNQDEQREVFEVSPAENIILSKPAFLPGSGSRGNISTLLKGVWINTLAIEKAFSETDTLTVGLQSLLTKMNNATGGYWNLQLLSSDETAEGPGAAGLHVVDTGLSKQIGQPTRRVRDETLTSVTSPINNKQGILSIDFASGADDVGKNTPKYVYVFNERNKVSAISSTQRLSNTTSIEGLSVEGIGSELIDLNVDFGLPVAIAAQVIAGVGGSAQKGTLEVIDVNELNDISIFPRTLVAMCNNPTSAQELPCYNDPATDLQLRLNLLDTNEKQDIANLGPRPDPTTRRRLLSFGEVVTAEEWDTAVKNITEKYEKRRRNLLTDVPGAQNTEQFQRYRSIIADYGYAGTVLRLIELNPAEMLRKLNIDSRDDIVTDESTGEQTRLPKVHAFNSSNLTKVLVDLTLPGITGIHLFQTFLVDRIPSVLQKGYYVVTKITHEIAPTTGWITKIQGRFRYDPLTEAAPKPRVDGGLEVAPSGSL